jgi:hypothetical protein
MYKAGIDILTPPHKTEKLEFKQFELNDKELIQSFADKFNPWSCEYNFANLFTWQGGYKTSFAIYKGRFLIHVGSEDLIFLPLGETLYPEELAVLSMILKNMGLSPDINLVSSEYLEKFPEIETYYTAEKVRDVAEYIYDIDSMCDLTGVKLRKKRNLIVQFKRAYPEFEVHKLSEPYRVKAFAMAKAQLENTREPSKTLKFEFCAIEKSFAHFEDLGLDGRALMVGETLVGFSVFSKLNASTYDIQFEKFDKNFKGAGQVINHETATYLKNKCQYLNREQDLGIQGLRHAKLSYDPVDLIIPNTLHFNHCF